MTQYVNRRFVLKELVKGNKTQDAANNELTIPDTGGLRKFCGHW